MRVDEAVAALWESRTACGKSFCPHTSSTAEHGVVHTIRPVVHSYPQKRAQQGMPRAVHRLCMTPRVHSAPGKNARQRAVCGCAPDVVVHPSSRDHADVTTHRSPVDDCGQLDPHAVYERSLRRGHGSGGPPGALYPQFDAPRWASLWMGVDSASETGVGGHEPSSGQRCESPRVREGVRRRSRIERWHRPQRSSPCERDQEDGEAGGVPPRCPGRERAATSARRAEVRRHDRTVPAAGHGVASQPRCCCLIRLVSSVTWL